MKGEDFDYGKKIPFLHVVNAPGGTAGLYYSTGGERLGGQIGADVID